MFAADICKTEPGNFLAGSIQEEDSAFKIGRQQTTAHGINNVLVEGLQILQLAALLFQLRAFAAQRLRQPAGKISDRKERREIRKYPGLQFLRTRSAERSRAAIFRNT